MTISQMLKWQGSKRAEGWLGRRAARLDFAHMSELCTDIARALEAHRDIDANELLSRLQTKIDTSRKLPVFGGRK